MERVIRSRSPVGLEGTSIVVLEPERVVLGGVPVCDLQDAAPLLPGVRDSVRLLGRDHELVPGTSLDHLVADLDPEALVEHDPELVPELVVVLARLVPGLDRDHADRGRLVEGGRLAAPPRGARPRPPAPTPGPGPPPRCRASGGTTRRRPPASARPRR